MQAVAIYLRQNQKEPFLLLVLGVYVLLLSNWSYTS